MKMTSSLAIVNLKSFGDMTIAVRAIKMLHDEDASNLSLLLGSHHIDLYRALQPNIHVEFVDLKYHGVPAFYDLRDMGIMKGFYSFVDAYTSLNKHKVNHEVLLFDVVSWREKLLTIGTKSLGLDTSEQNIYRNYRQTFLSIFGRVKDEVINKGIGKTILILPHGRKTFRSIPTSLVDIMSSLCIANGFEPVVYMLEGETPIACSIPRTINAKRSFIDLRNTIDQSCAVISADSLAAHLTTYLAKPVFVATPYLKTLYWLPPHTQENHYWGLFSETQNLTASLERFLQNLNERIDTF